MSKVELNLATTPVDKKQFSFHVDLDRMKVFDSLCKKNKISRGRLLEKFVDLVSERKVVIK